MNATSTQNHGVIRDCSGWCINELVELVNKNNLVYFFTKTKKAGCHVRNSSDIYLLFTREKREV